jgi:hypothetical protein
MLTRILHNNEALITFIEQLNLDLSKSQKQHIINVADGLLVTDAPKTLAEIQLCPTWRIPSALHLGRRKIFASQ